MTYKIQSDREHILDKNTGVMWVGELESNTHNEFILDEYIKNIPLQYSSALNKIINEIIDNSVDALNKKKKAKIDIIIKDNIVTVKDNGDGIPIKYIKDLKGDDILIPRACWGKAKSGSSFDKAKDNNNLGTFGVGSFATNTYSIRFTGITCDGIKEYKGIWTNNAGEYKEEIKTKKTKGTTVIFEPDLKRFEVESIDSDLLKVIKQRIINLSMTYTNITFTFNKDVIKFKPSDMVQAYGENATVFEDDKFTIAILPNNDNNFECFTTMNGLNLKGGNHIDYVTKYIVEAIKNKLPKKYDNSIKNGDIKNKIKILFIGKEFPRIKFESQTKETLKNNTKDISEYLGQDWKSIINKVIKNKEIISNITEYADIKAEQDARRALKSLDKPRKKKIKNDKYLPSIGENNIVAICEGDSALAGLSSVLGRDGISYYAMFGVPPNAYDINIKDIAKSKKLLDLKEILGLSFTTDEQKNITHDNIVIATDADLPGFFIRGQLLGLFFRFGKNLFKEGKIKILNTPLLVLKDKDENIIKWFYDFEVYQEFLRNNKDLNKYNTDYKKGLGSWSSYELDYIIEQEGIESMLETITIDENSNIDNWLNSKKADERKEMLKGYEFSILNM